MACVLEFLVVVALILMSIAVMVGTLEPGEALRRAAVVLVLLFVVPGLALGLIRSVILPALSAVIPLFKHVTLMILVFGAIALIGWSVVQQVKARFGKANGGKE